VACVARVLEPGVKFDHVLTIVGEEGQGKSTLLKSMGGRWFSDTFNMHMLATKEAYEQVQGAWIIEIGELTGMAKAEVERVKGFLAASKDRYRTPYARVTAYRWRECVFFGTTNSRDFLKSQTGNRRFWPVATYVTQPMGSAFDLSKADIDQLWAEAVYLFKAGEKLYLDKDMEAEAVIIQNHYTEENPMVDEFQEYLALKIPENWYELSRWDKLDIYRNYEPKDEYITRIRVSKKELWEIAMEKKDKMSIYDLQLVKAAMKKVKGWKIVKEAVRFGISYSRERGSYQRVPERTTKHTA
jgi:predicted P-loop ATPase